MLLTKELIPMVNTFMDMPSGKAKIEYMKMTIKEADRIGDLRGQLYVRDKLMHESCMHGDGLDMFAVFPEMVRVYEENASKFGDDDADDIIWNFKWIIEGAPQFYQINAETVRKYMERFKEYLIKYGYSLYTYHYMKIVEEFLCDRGRVDVLNQHYENMQKYTRDRMSDCQFCEKGLFIGVLLANGKVDEAFEKLEEITSVGDKCYCSEQPGGSYLHFADYYFEKKEHEPAAKYYEMYYKESKKKNFYPGAIGKAIAGISFINTGKALKLFIEQTEDERYENNPEYLFYHYLGGAYLWKNMMKDGKETISLEFASKYPIGTKKGECKLQDLYDYFVNKAEVLGEKLDKSNESDGKMRMLKMLEKEGERC